jgi:hypothetical protein
VLRIPDGEMLGYVHMGYDSRFERDILLHIERGRLTKTEVKENRKARRGGTS